MPDAVLTSARKILAGPRLKRLRRERGLTQARMAEELTVSPSYLNLMERNQRPLTVPVLARLTEAYGIDPREFMEDQADAAVESVEQILTDPIFRDLPVARAELHDAAEYAPSVVAAMRRLYAAYAGRARRQRGPRARLGRPRPHRGAGRRRPDRARARDPAGEPQPLSPSSTTSPRPSPPTWRWRVPSRSTSWRSGCARATASACA